METEKMKAQAGLLYDANYDAELLAERTACADRLYELNLLRPSQEEERKALLRKLLGKTKENFCIVSPFHCDYGYNIEVGENFFMNAGCVILDGARVTFGDIGAHVCVLPGVIIGEGSVIGAGSVVTKDIPPHVLAVGNPCRVIREITEEDKKKYWK